MARDKLEEVGKILDTQVVEDSDGEEYRQYKVQWKKARGTNWVNEDDCNCPNSIFEYEKSQGLWDEPCEVEGIIEEIENSVGQTEYLVKWKDTEEWKNSCSWVKESDFVETELLDQFKTDEDYHFDHQQPVVEKILRVNRKPYDKYQVQFKNTPLTGYFHTIDEIYVRPGGRKAIRAFYRSNETEYPSDPYQLI